MAVLASDTFTPPPNAGVDIQGSTLDIGGNWNNPSGAILINDAGNAAFPNVTNCVYDTAINPVDYSVYADVDSSLPTVVNDEFGVIARSDSAGVNVTFYFGTVILTGGGLKARIGLVKNGTTILGTSGVISGGVGKLKLSITGRKLTLFWKDIKVVGPLFDSSISAGGYAGLYSSFSTLTNVNAWDNFGVEGVGVPVAPRARIVRPISHHKRLLHHSAFIKRQWWSFPVSLFKSPSPQVIANAAEVNSYVSISQL